MSFLGYGSTGNQNNDSGSANVGNKKGDSGKQHCGEDVRILAVDPIVGVSSSSRPRDDYFHRNSYEALISADGLMPSVAGVKSRTSASEGVNEKSPLNSLAYNSNDSHPVEDMDLLQGQGQGHQHKGCFHRPGEHCSLPNIIQPLVSPLHHNVVENVVIKVRDSADVTQKTIFYFWDEWKLFVNRGNVIDLGIGVVIGGAFSDIIDSFVADILTPPLSLWAAGTNLENSFIVLKHGRTPGKVYTTYFEAQADGAVTENTGHFLKACLNFMLIAFFLFWIVKAVHNIRKEKIKPPPKEKTCNWCRESIALDAFRCKFCQSFVKDIPGIEDAGVGMFVTIKRPKHQSTMSVDSTSTPAGTTPGAVSISGAAIAATATAGKNPIASANRGAISSSVAAKDGKRSSKEPV